MKFKINVLDLVFNFLNSHPKKVMAFWIIGALSGAFFAMDLPNYAVFTFLPPSGSKSEIAYDKIRRYFPKFLFEDFEVVVIQSHGGNVVCNATHEFLIELNDTLWNKVNNHYHLMTDFGTYYDYTVPHDSGIYELYRDRFVSSDNSTMIAFIALDIDGVQQNKLNGFIDSASSKISDLRSKYNRLYSDVFGRVAMTGALTMWTEGMTMMQDDMTTKDMMMMPLIYALMMYMIGSWRLIILPGVSLLMAIIISLSGFLPFAKYNVCNLNPLAPSIMLFLCMALSVDYSMFLLSRFASEIRAKSSVQRAVREMIRYSAHVVVLSGMVLFVGYIGITLFPISGMETVGYGSCFTVVVAVSINITFISASILAFPKFFGNLEAMPRVCNHIGYLVCCCCKSRFLDNLASNDASSLAVDDGYATLNLSSQVESVHSINAVGIKDEYDDDGMGDELSSFQSRTKLRAHDGAQNLYFRVTQVTTRAPWNYILPIAVYAMMAPVIYVLLTEYKYTMDFTMYFPTNSMSIRAYNSLLRHFPPSILFPFYILGITQNRDTLHTELNTIWNERVFSSFCYSSDRIRHRFDMKSTDFHSVMFAPTANGTQIDCLNDWESIEALKHIYRNNGTSLNESFPGYLYEYLQTVVSDTETASVYSLMPPFNPMLQSAVEPSLKLRDLVETINANASIRESTQFYVHNSLYWQIDSMNQTNSQMPWMMSIIIFSIFVLIAVMFRAYLLPLRLFFAVVIPIAFVYGLCVGVYCIGWCDWMGWDSMSKTSGIIWMGPTVTITILLGLAMDYEIFLFSRVFEYRNKGYNSRAAIILGVANTGPIISSAGTVMAMAFGGMMLLDVQSSNQMGFLFVFGVLIDTFVIRPLLVPSMLSLVDWINWWPRKVPQTNLLDEYGKMQENDDDHNDNDNSYTQ